MADFSNIIQIMKLIIVLFAVLVAINADVIPFDSTAVETIFQKKQPALFLFVAD